METAQSSNRQTARPHTLKRCVNLDWLEVFAREPIGQPHTADYFRSHGIEVEEREYGTRVYREMFTLMGSDGLPCIEVRRNPASQNLNGIHDAEETHIRLVNRMCYFDDAAIRLKEFLEFHHYTDVRISRIDICLDFVRFDFGDEPARFVRRYLEHKYVRINASDLDLHGKDAWEGIDINSLKWGSPYSMVSTKMYNKTMELKNAQTKLFGKPYIRQAWYLCGFIDNMQLCTLQGQEVNVWRIEYSIKSPKANWFTIELDGKPNNKYSLRNTLSVYQNRNDLLTAFASLTRHYFHFKIYEKGVRKYRCKDKKLFDFSDVQNVYKLTLPQSVAGDGDKHRQKFNRLLRLLNEYDMTLFSGDTKNAVQTLITAINEEITRADLAKPWNAEELAILRAMFSKRAIQNNWDRVDITQVLTEVFNVSESSRSKLL